MTEDEKTHKKFWERMWELEQEIDRLKAENSWLKEGLRRRLTRESTT